MIKLKNLLLVFFYIVLITHAYSQNISLNNIGSLTNILNESSGITFIAPNRLYTHDDSSGNDEIYEIDTLGNLIRTININNANNTDWEDITKDNLNNIYIGNFGNNDNDRTNLKIYKIPNPTSFSGNTTTAQVIEFNYPDQTMFPPNPSKRNYDVEGFVWFNDSLFLFTKNRTSPFNGYCKMYKIPATPGTHTAQICDSIFLCNNSQSNCWVTAAALSNDNSHLALLNDSKIWWFSCFNGSSFFKGAMATANLSSNTQKEGITFKNNYEVFITDEQSTTNSSGGSLYKANLSSYLEMSYVNIIADSIICDNCTLTVDSFIGSLSWSNGMFSPSIMPTYTGWHYVTAKNINNCAVSDSVYISYLQGTNEHKYDQLNINIQTSSNTLIAGTIDDDQSNDYKIQLCDITGKVITSTSIQRAKTMQTFALNVNLKNGLYLLNIFTSKRNKTYKLVISN
jgi:hypothetical protein